MIKIRYSSYLTRYLGRAMAGEDEPSKRGALSTASSLLMRVPEGEELLLSMIANKIGDPARKIASAAGHALRLILDEHPAMVNVVAREVSEANSTTRLRSIYHFLAKRRAKCQNYPSMIVSLNLPSQVQQLAHRPHLSPRALYCCVVFLNQLQLSRDDHDEDTDEDNDGAVTNNGKKIKSPSATRTSLPASLINTYFHLFEMTVRKEEANKKKQNSSSSAKKSNHSNDSSSSSASGMKSRLLSALLTGVNRAHPYLPRKDAAMEQHIDALYRISHTAPPSASTQALMLLFQLAVGQGEPSTTVGVEQDESVVTNRKDRFYRALYSKLLDNDMFAGRQLTLFFNLLYKAIKYDNCHERISAFVMRLLHSVLHLSSSIICGSLFLLSEIVRYHPELRRELEDGVSAGTTTFDPTKREPRAAQAASTKDLWELSLLAHHYHPSVSKFTAGCDGEISYKGDPLKDFALQPFLDKFAFRNPKSLDKLSKQLKRGVSIAERKSGLGSGSIVLPMNDPSYLESRNISEENFFFHKFFVERARRDEMKGIVRGTDISNKDKDDSDLEDEALDAAEADEMIDNFEGDTDSEEEAFVNQLAEKLMESSGNGKTNFDDEDPDMDDWSDFEDDKTGDDGNGEDENDDDSAELSMDENEDAFMDVASSDEEEGEDVFDAQGDGDDSDGGSDDHDDSYSEKKSMRNDDNGQAKRKKSLSPFADADEYEKLLEEELKLNPRECDNDSDSSMEEFNASEKKKRRHK
jgi:ribosome biogenesis protein MAK21